MVKAIIKETCIMILLCVCVILLFGIVFYDYIPVSKVVPNKVAYEVPDDIQEELQIDVEKEQITTQTITYSLSGSDLSQFANSGRLEEGKPNPFAPYTETSSNATITNGITTGGNSTGNSGTYYPNTGTK